MSIVDDNKGVRQRSQNPGAPGRGQTPSVGSGEGSLLSEPKKVSNKTSSTPHLSK